MIKRILVAAVWVLAASVLWAGARLDGRVVIAHPGYADYTFSRCYVYVVEVEEYFPVGADGVFEIAVEGEAVYTLQPRCPGFIADFTLVQVPYEGEFPLELELQMIEITVRIVQEIPAYILSLKDTVESIKSQAGDLSDNQYNNLLHESLREKGPPVIDAGAIIRFIRDQIEKRRK